LILRISRVTKLGEFKPNGRLFSLVSFLRTKVAQHFWPCVNFDKNWIGPNFGRFF
jgi:hypothetical protein